MRFIGKTSSKRPCANVVLRWPSRRPIRRTGRQRSTEYALKPGPQDRPFPLGRPPASAFDSRVRHRITLDLQRFVDVLLKRTLAAVDQRGGLIERHVLRLCRAFRRLVRIDRTDAHGSAGPSESLERESSSHSATLAV